MSVFDKKKGIGRPRDGEHNKVSVSISLSLSTANQLLLKPSGERSAFVEKAIINAFNRDDFDNES